MQTNNTNNQPRQEEIQSLMDGNLDSQELEKLDLVLMQAISDRWRVVPFLKVDGELRLPKVKNKKFKLYETYQAIIQKLSSLIVARKLDDNDFGIIDGYCRIFVDQFKYHCDALEIKQWLDFIKDRIEEWKLEAIKQELYQVADNIECFKSNSTSNCIYGS